MSTLTIEDFREAGQRNEDVEAVAAEWNFELDLFDHTAEAFLTYPAHGFIIQTDNPDDFHLYIDDESWHGDLQAMEAILYSTYLRDLDEKIDQSKPTLIDLTPTWTAMAPAIAAILSDGSEKGRKEIMPELGFMAELADERNKLAKRIRDAADMLTSALLAHDAEGGHLSKEDWADTVRDALNDLNGENE